MTLQQLFHHKDRWTKRTRARDIDGYACEAESPSAVAFCLLGGLNKCYQNNVEWFAALRKLQQAIEPPGMTVVEWNDDPDRTFEEVSELIKKAGV